MKNDTEYILASGSPRRKELLARAGLKYRVLVSDADEDYPEGLKPEEIVKLLAGRKGHAVAELLKNGKETDGTSVHSDVTKQICVISADTIVVLDDRILGKPADRNESEKMIRALQGRDHQVWTGVQVIYMSEEDKSIGQEICFADCTTVHVISMDDAEIKAYVDGGEGDDKAGAYAIQGDFAKYISGYDGDFDNVVGLPVTHLMEVLNSKS